MLIIEGSQRGDDASDKASGSGSSGRSDRDKDDVSNRFSLQGQRP